MIKEEGPSFLLSVIILLDEHDPAWLQATLTSIAGQTLGRGQFEVILVSKFPLEKKDTAAFKDLRIVNVPGTTLFIDTIRMVTGLVRGRFIFIINSGDRIDREYLKKSVMVLGANERIGFTYGILKKFGFSETSLSPEEFHARTFFFHNWAHGAVYRADVFRRVCASLHHRTYAIKEVFRHHMIIKIMAQGYWGKPVNDQTYYLFTDTRISNPVRAELNYETLSMLLRSCMLDFFFVQKAERNHKRFLKCGGENDRLLPRPLEMLLGVIFSSIFGLKIKYVPLMVFWDFLFRGETFRKNFLEKKYIPSEAELLCGFVEKPDVAALTAVPKSELKNTIVFAHGAWVPGGGEKVLLKWIASLGADQDRPRLIDVGERSYADASLMREEFRACVDEQYAMDRLADNPRQIFRNCWELIVSERPKVLFIMSNSYFYTLMPHIKKCFPGMQVVDLLHNEYADDPGWFSISNEYKQWMDQRIVVSHVWKQLLVEKYREQPGRVLVCENGVDLEKFDPLKYDKQQLRARYDLTPETRVVGFIGRINRQKNPEVFLGVAKALLHDTRFRFFFIGNKDDVPEYVKEIESMMEQLPNVRYFGYSENVPEFMAVMDVLVLPSKFEGYPLISLEAAAMGLPVIAADIVGFREQVQAGQFGLLYEQRTEEEHVRAIQDILLNWQDELRTCASAGPKFAAERCDSRNNSKVYRNELWTLLKRAV